jgi:hypothetical protein
MMLHLSCGELVAGTESKYNRKTESGFAVGASHRCGQVLLHVFGFGVESGLRLATNAVGYRVVAQISLMR